MFKLIFKKRTIQEELVSTINHEIWLLEEYLNKNSYKGLGCAEKNEILARLRVIKNNTSIMNSINK